MPAVAATIEANGTLESRLCPQCASGRNRIVSQYSVEPWQLVQCTTCAFIYLKNVPTYERQADDLVWDKSHVVERQRRLASYPVMNLLERMTHWRLSLTGDKRARVYRRLFKEGRVLDIGCGSGHKLPEPLIPFGIEISPASAREANALMSPRGGRVVCAPAIKGIAEFPDRYFSGVILSSFLEHEVNPEPLLKQVARVLTDDGKAWVRVPNFGSINRRLMGARWCGFRHPDHVNYFNADSLRRMAHACGLRMKLLNRISLPLDDNIKALLFKA